MADFHANAGAVSDDGSICDAHGCWRASGHIWIPLSNLAKAQKHGWRWTLTNDKGDLVAATRSNR